MKKILAAVAALALATTIWAQNVVVQSGYTVLYDDAGRVLLVVASSAPTLPVAPPDNALLWRTDEAKFYVWSGGAWSSALAVGTLTGDLTGDVTGNLTGDVTGDVVGSVSGGTVGGTVGTLLQARVEHADAAVGTAADCGKTVTNTGDDDGSGYTLPDDAPSGCRIKVLLDVAQTFTVTVSSGESLLLGADPCAAGTITCADDGDSVVLEVSTAGASGAWAGEGDAGSTGCTCDDA